MFLCWGESDLSIAFSTHLGSQASSRGEAKDTALLSSRDGYILELTVCKENNQFIGHGNPLLYPCLENPMDRGAWQAMVHGVTKSWPRLK